ncbi:DUF2339 domain-containing protein [Ramlibacter sp. AW1]|uniref:DUF2339 domain-containing protein n=1 Tax=Ramlibacter aurantiacus TaxID=2801330 RepID=A0A937D510_9BURK|nr:DUF2339 domain-containing protein [Ramlibacter aurantiacus]MBL0420862.1 DUF2339 domain-containing protein [Ramlibacter aurantiacus]
MLIWGAAWGALLGLVWPGPDPLFRLLLGAVLGLAAGATLRNAVRREMGLGPAGKAVPAAAEQPVSRDTAPIAAPPPSSPRVQPPGAARRPLPVEASAPPRWTVPWPDAARRLGRWVVGGNAIVRIGVLVLFVGLAFLARYAIDHALLPPSVRLGAVALAGLGLLAAGWRLRHREGRGAYALTLQGGGSAALYLAVFAALRLYQLLPPGIAFAALALVCALAVGLALAQDTQALAVTAFAGGFAAPLLVSTGQGSHVMLFAYFLVLGLAIAAIANWRPWRVLNWVGFMATFAIATAWGVLQYSPARLASVQPFLLAFFAVYLAITLLHALRHGLGPRRAVDATLVFALPLIGFGLQAALVREIEFGAAFSALALAATYLVLGLWLARRYPQPGHPGRWLAECFAALGLGFATLAVPLALDGRWTSAVWAVEGAGVYWLGRRQERRLARAAGLLLQLFAALAYLGANDGAHRALLPLANPVFIGALMLAGSAWGIGWWARQLPAAPAARPLAQRFDRLERQLPAWLFWIGFLWLQYGLHREIGRAPLDAMGRADPVFSPALQLHLKLLAWVVAAFVAERAARPGLARAWPVAATPAWTVLPVLLLGAIAAFDHPLSLLQGGWLLWPPLLLLHARLLRRLDAGEPAGWWPWVHAGGVWLLALLVARMLVHGVDQAGLWRTGWASVVWLVAGIALLLPLCRRRGDDAPSDRWPLDRFALAYRWIAAAPLAALLLAGSLAVAVGSSGDARPLPYLPLLNPTDLALALALATVTTWLLGLRGSALPVPPTARDARWLWAPAAAGFIALNTAWLRIAHHWGGVPWRAEALWSSFGVQAGYSILWTLLALGLMVTGFRRGWRALWMGGGALLAATVLKLFLVDLANRGGGERIVVFLAVGLLMLVLGYVAPIPPPPRSVPAGGREVTP